MSIGTTVIGSWWVPAGCEEELQKTSGDDPASPARAAALQWAAELAVAEQRELGLDEWTGGEFFTEHFLDHIPRMLTGIQTYQTAADEVVDYDDLTKFTITGDISAPAGLGYARAYARERAIPGGVTKATVPGPFELVEGAFDRDGPLDLSGPIQAQLPNLVKIVRTELANLAELGCPNISLDVPIIGTLVNMGQMTPAAGADLIRQCLDGIPGRRSIHFCNGNLMGKPASRILGFADWITILQRLDGVVEVACLEMKYAAQWHEREALRRLPDSISFAAGIVDEAQYVVEPVAKIQDRIAELASLVGTERLRVCSSCGFGRHPLADRPALRQKIRNMVAASKAFGA